MLYKKLRRALRAEGYIQEDVADIISRSQTYVSNRFRGVKSWEIEDAFKILDAINVEPKDMPKYFPRGGITVEEERPKVRRFRLVAEREAL